MVFERYGANINEITLSRSVRRVTASFIIEGYAGSATAIGADNRIGGRLKVPALLSDKCSWKRHESLLPIIMD